MCIFPLKIWRMLDQQNPLPQLLESLLLNQLLLRNLAPLL
jgi:hypothetical protein